MHPNLSRRQFGKATGGLLLGAVGLGSVMLVETRKHEFAGRRWAIEPERLKEVPQWMEVGAVPGVAAVGIHGAQVDWALSLGVADVRRDEPIDRDTLFELASLGKPVTAYIALQLRDEGLLDLDRPVLEYVPDEELLQGNARLVTARHLFSHTAGFPNWRNQPGAFSPADPPGHHFAYSGEGYFLLQRVIESVADQPFERLARTRVFVPLE